MNKSYLSRETKDGTQLTIEQIAAICPSAVTEVRDGNTGEIVRKVNFTTLRQLLGDLAVDTPREAYDFTWVGKNAYSVTVTIVINGDGTGTYNGGEFTYTISGNKLSFTYNYEDYSLNGDPSTGTVEVQWTYDYSDMPAYNVTRQ